MLQSLIMNLFNWLPVGLYLPVAAIIGIAFFSVVLKLVLIILDFIFKFFDLFT